MASDPTDPYSLGHQIADAFEQAKQQAQPGNGASQPKRRSSTEQGVMREFVADHAETLRFDHDRGRWLVWDGHYWRPDLRKKAFFWVLKHCHELNKAKTAKASFANAVESMARVMPPISTASADWNPDPTLVACPEGVIELPTGLIRPGKPADMIDRALAVAPQNSLPATKWFAFLDTMFNGNGEVIDFLQRWFGYALSGEISEHKFVFMHGTGANGKGTLLNTVSAIWGDLCATASIDVFLESNVERHPTELARLHGAHMVVVHETREGRRWDEARIKALTGGDRIAARFMRRDEFEFSPRFKPVFAGNHRPALRSVDEAIRRRLLLLPCAVTIPPDQRNPKLWDELKPEWPQILHWAVEGYPLWRRLGLRPPSAVTAATNDYLANQDDLALWIAERTKPLGYGWTIGKDLFADWREWKEARKELPGSQRAFNDQLLDRGFPREVKKAGVCFQNIDLINPRPPY